MFYHTILYIKKYLLQIKIIYYLVPIIIKKQPQHQWHNHRPPISTAAITPLLQTNHHNYLPIWQYQINPNCRPKKKPTDWTDCNQTHSIRFDPNPNSTGPTQIKTGFHRRQQAWLWWPLWRRTLPSRTLLTAHTLIFMASLSLAPSSTSPPSLIPLFFLWLDEDLFGLWWFHFWVLFWIENWSLIWGAKREKDVWGWGRSWESDLKRKEHRLGERDRLWGEKKNQLKKWEERPNL